MRENNDLPCDTEWCGKLKVPSDRGKRLLNKSRWLTFQSQEIETFISKDGGLTSFYQIFQINLSLSLTNTNITLDKPQNPNHQQPLGRRPNSIMARQKRIKIRCKGHECHAFAKAARNSYTKIGDLLISFCKSSGKKIDVLRLPVGHSEFNPKELIWALVKSDVVKKNNF